MIFNILFETTSFDTNEFKQNFLQKNNISITFYSENNYPKNLNIFNIAFLNTYNENLIDMLQKENIAIVFLVNQLEEIEELYKNNIHDFVIKPFLIEKLENKIEFYHKQLFKNKTILKEKAFSSSLIEASLNPFFLTDGKKVFLSNKIFNKLIEVNSTQEISEKILDIGSIFLEKKGFINKNKNWLNKCETSILNKCIIKNSLDQEFIFVITSKYLKEQKLHLVCLDDITVEQKYQNKFLSLLYTDNLTNLPNRTKLIEDVKNKEKKIQSVAILDINSFKVINDFYGHKIGDMVLLKLAKLTEHLISNSSELTLYKLPSDTYGITNTSMHKELFEEIIAKIIKTINKKSFHFHQHELDLRVNAGISFSEKNNKLVTADIALQTAKQKRKEYLVFYNELDNLQEYENNMLWTKKVKSALLEDKIIVYYQPIINNQLETIEKFECLVRMIDGNKIISPYFFLDISKKSNQYKEITKIVIEKSFKKFSTLKFDFSVNISYEDIEDNTFLQYIKDMLKEYKVNKRVVFEILEDENIKDYDILINFINEVKQLGCKVAIDDFGTGYSNFEHLLKLDIDYLKIDASLIKNIATDENSLKITKTIIEFAKNLNLKTIAEFVESEEIYIIVKELGADFSQGYHFSAPISDPKDINL